ncbi:OX-2 membrane glycoprotein-like [Vanacampus margaritifer]
MAATRPNRHFPNKYAGFRLISRSIQNTGGASPQIITGFGDTALEYGEDAYYKCELQEQKGVHQVTWQKRLRDHSIENVASYNKPYGRHINEPYRDKVILGETSLSSASLTIKNVTWADECCYICIFNAYREHSKRKQTCLTVHGISEVKAEAHPPDEGLADGNATVVFSCSATGKPAPSIRWRFLPNHTVFHQTATATVDNQDRTFTSSRNVTLRLSASWDGHADCLLQSGGRGEKMARVPFFWDPGVEEMVAAEGADGGLPKTSQTPLVAGVVTAALVTALAVVVSIARARKKHLIFRNTV